MRRSDELSFVESRGTRRGVALLLALVCLSIVSLAGVSLLRVASDASIAARQTRLRVDAEAMARDAERVALAWLERGGFEQIDEGVDISSFVRVATVEDERDGETLSVTIDALDLSGRLHLSRLGTHAARGLPPSIAALRETDMAAQFARRTATARRSSPRDIEPLTPTLRGALDRAQGQWLREFPHSGGMSLGNDDAACLWVTTQGAEPFALNVNSAPLPLLEASLTGRDPAASARALAARSERRPVPPEVIATLSGAGPQDAVALTGSSSAVGFLVTVRDARGIARFWIAAERDGSRSAARPRANSGGGWTIVERRGGEG